MRGVELEILAQGPLESRFCRSDDGRLIIERAGQIVLSSVAPAVRARRGDEWRPIPNGLSSNPWATSDGFMLNIAVPDAEEIEIAWELASGGHWYGLGELLHQHWPLEQGSLPVAPFLTWDNGPSGLGGILEPLWLTSSGIGLWIQEDIQLSIGLNAPLDGAPIPPWDLGPTQRPAHERPAAATDRPGDGLLRVRTQGPALTMQIFIGADLQQAQRAFLARAGRPRAAPPAPLLHSPIWTTWARYKSEITQEAVLAFVDEIEAHGFPIGTLEIDDRWQRAYGDLAFDPVRFPDPAAMIAALHDRGIRVTAWVIPFIAAEAEAFPEARERGYLIHDEVGEPIPIVWWQGIGHSLDVSNPKALAWFQQRLAHLQAETGLDGYKFDAGEVCFLPPNGQMATSLPENRYTHHYVDFVARHFPYSEVRAGWRNQSAPILFRQWDKASVWGRDNGLGAVLTQALTMSLIGYPFVLADMIGGNEYGEQRTTSELLVRWAQANALLPAMQFSLAPWDHDPETVALCRAAAQLHATFGPEFAALAATATSGDPIIRPLVWQFPDDPSAATIHDQFMLGDRWLVAPVVTPGAESRAIYLPAGAWRHPTTREIIRGPIWLPDFPAPLDTLPYFELM